MKWSITFLSLWCCLLQAHAKPYIWKNVAIVGGGFVTGIITHPAEKGLIYARTDVGGAYRWDVSKDGWIPLTDWIDKDHWSDMGVESVAIDPSCMYGAVSATFRSPGVLNARRWSDK